MDPKLAEIYGTNQETEADLEKLAAAELAEGLANDGELSTEGMTEEELEAVAQDVLSASGEEVEEQEKTSAAEEAQEKLAEADYLGRVMAHAYVNELKGIEKEAAGKGTLAQKGGRVLEAIGSKLTPGKLADKAFSKGKLKSMQEARKGGASISDLKRTMTQHRSAGAERVGKLHKGVGAGAVGVGAAGLAGGAYAAKKKMEKKSSALDTLVEARAMEILQASGIDPAELEQAQGQEKVSDPREALAGAVEERAWALLGQYGVVPAEQGEE